MKKYFLSLVAIAAAMLFATSCQESLVEPQMEGPTTFTVQLPDAMGTKAEAEPDFGHANNVDKLLVEVYPAGQTSSSLFQTVAEVKEGKATVALNLIQGQLYDILFWAQKGNNYVQVTKDGNTYSFDNNLTSIPMNDNFLNNDNGAAFFHAEKNFKPSGTPTPITLYRPFAQLNLGTTDASLNTNAGKYTLVRSSISVSGMATTFNAYTGEGEGEQNVTYNFEEAAVPTQPLKVGENTYNYVSMNYLSVLGNEKDLLDEVVATIIVKNAAGIEMQPITHTFELVPVQENYRTNIVGNLISSTTDFNVIVDDKFDGELPSTEEEKLRMAAQVGGEFTLTEDIELTQPLEVTGNMVINMNGKTIIGKMHKSVGAVIENNGTLTIKNGTISSTANNGGSAIKNNGTLTVEDATLNGAPNADGSWPAYTVNNTGVMTATNTTFTSYHGSVASYGEGAVVTLNDSEIDMEGIPGFTNHGIYTYNDGKVVVNGGTYANKATDQVATGASVINGAVEVNAGTFTGRIENYSGTPVLKGGIYSVKPNEKFIAEGYKAVEKDGKFYVVEGDVEIVITDPTKLDEQVLTTYKNILLQLSAGEHIIDLYMTRKPSLSYDANLTIIGTKGTKVAFAEGQVMMELVKNFTIKNCEILHMATKSWGMLVFGSGNKTNGVYTIENCTFNGVGTQGIYINENVSGAIYNITNCTFNGNFGIDHDGAITIQTNKDVECIVNVKGCEFKNIPDGCRRIYLASSTEGLFYDLTLNTDIKATTAYELEMFLELGKAQLGCDLTFSASETSAESGYKGATGVKVSDDAVLDGQGHILTVNDALTTWSCAIAATGGEIKDLTVSGAFRGIFMPGADGDVYIDNVIFKGVTYTFNSDDGSKDFGVYISNSTLNGWTSHSDVHKEVVYTNCSFGEGNGYAFCRPYGPTSFVGCDFVAGFEVDARGLITFENCTIGGVALTAENLSTLVTSNIANASVK